jgi:hypothetical protein
MTPGQEPLEQTWGGESKITRSQRLSTRNARVRIDRSAGDDRSHVSLNFECEPATSGPGRPGSSTEVD